MIDRTPALGRYVIRQSDEPGGWIDPTWIGRITGIRGKQLTFDRHSEGFGVNLVESRKLLVWKIAAVCDTADEVRHLLKVNEECWGLYWDYLAKRKALIDSKIGRAEQ